VTNWSFRTPAYTWYHVALVNNGETTDLYINGSKDVRNSHDISVGLRTTGQYWLLGATTWLDSVGQSMYGWLGGARVDTRRGQASNHCLAPSSYPWSPPLGKGFPPVHLFFPIQRITS